MVKLRHLLPKLFFCSTIFIGCAFAQSSLTQILDTVFNGDGSTFTGTLILSWNGFTGPSGGTIAPHSTSVQIVNGALSVFLVPSTTASSGAYYIATYNSSNGTVTWTELWQVPPSTSPLTLNQVRQPASGGGTGGGTGGGGVQYATLPISIAEITGLGSDLNAIDGSLSTLTTTINGVTSTVTALGSSVANLTSAVNNLSSGSNPAFVDGERPSGTINGVNGTFTLSAAPSPALSLDVYRNGLMQTKGVDFTLAGTTITFAINSLPQSGDILQTFYRVSGVGPTFTFADDEVPAGTINGANLAFTLAAPPTPALSLRVYRNGVLMLQNGDYTLIGKAITFASTTVAPKTGDSLVAFYRH